MCKISLKKRLRNAIFGVIFAVLGILGITTSPLLSNPVYAEPEPSESTSVSENTDNVETCYSQVPGLGWLVCNATNALGKAVDSIYSQIEELLIVQPVSFEDSSPVYQIWQIMRDITNIVFVIFLLIVVYSQITGLGISNYGIKKALPKLIIAAILVNLSYLICALAVDVSNVLGASIRGLFESIEVQAINTGGIGDVGSINWTTLTAALIGGGAVAGIAIIHFIWPLIAALLGAIISVLIGLVTLGLRQALIIILVMIAPLALVCYLLPNTEKWFKKWKDTFISMIIFYPMFSFLFGAAGLAGWALIASAVKSGSAFMLIVGLAVQVLPLILSIGLMKMSGTVLGAVSSKLGNLANKPQEGIRANLAQRHELARLRRINNSALPSASLQRYLDKRNRHRALDIESENTIRAGRAEIYAQNQLIGKNKYDPAFNEEYKTGTKVLGTTTSSRAAKRAMDIKLEVQTTAKNAAHVLNNYGDYHNSTLEDQRLHTTAGKNYLDFYRAQRAEENDAYADQDWLIGQYDKFRLAKEDSYEYKHYITGGAGALGKVGENLVLGQVIHASAKNEAARRSYQDLVFKKWGYTKTNARDFLVGYAIDDDGFAVDPKTRKKLTTYTDELTGKTIDINERSPGEFLKYHPEYLKQSAYNLKDEHGYYYDATDQNGKFIGRVYKNDGAAIKEILSNWDMPINDPINGVYGILAGIDNKKFKEKYPYLGDVGLSGFSTTIQRATLTSGFKEKAAFAGPMYATSVGQRYIQDFIHLNIARLDNLIKTAKPSGFNTQDAAEFGQLKMLMDPENWDWMLFNEDSLRSFKNVNGRPMKGTRYLRDESGNFIYKNNGELKYEEIDSEVATLDDLKNTVIRKYLAPAAPKFATMMSRVTQNIMDNQKPGVADNWNGVLDSMEKWNDQKYKDKYPGLNNPFAEQTNDTISRAKTIGRQIRPKTQKTELVSASPELQVRKREAEKHANDKYYQRTKEDYQNDHNYEDYERNQAWYAGTQPLPYENHRLNIDMLAAKDGDDKETFIHDVKEYLDDASIDDDRINDVIDDLRQYDIDNHADNQIGTEEYAEYIKDLLSTYLYEN